MTRLLNLLPPERRAALGYEQLLNSLLVVVRGVLTGLLLLLLTAAALGIGLRILLTAVSTDTTAALDEQRGQHRTLHDRIDRHNLLLEELVRLDAERILWSRALGNLISVLPAGVTIDGLQIDAAALTLTLSGAAPDRAAVVEFENRLRALPWVAAASGPRDNLIDRVNPRYVFELRIDAAAANAL